MAPPITDHLRLVSSDPEALKGVLERTIVVTENNRAAINQVDVGVVALHNEMRAGFAAIEKRMDTIHTRMLIGFTVVTLFSVFIVVLSFLLVSHAIDHAGLLALFGK